MMMIIIIIMMMMLEEIDMTVTSFRSRGALRSAEAIYWLSCSLIAAFVGLGCNDDLLASNRLLSRSVFVQGHVSSCRAAAPHDEPSVSGEQPRKDFNEALSIQS
jgi:hypothetical protein